MQSCTLGICTDFAKRGQAGQILGSCINGACASDQLTCLAGQVCIPATKPKCTVSMQPTCTGGEAQEGRADASQRKINARTKAS